MIKVDEFLKALYKDYVKGQLIIQCDGSYIKDNIGYISYIAIKENYVIDGEVKKIQCNSHMEAELYAIYFAFLKYGKEAKYQTDNEVIYKQLKGEYKINELRKLLPIYVKLKGINIEWIPRGGNMADVLIRKPTLIKLIGGVKNGKTQ